LQLISYANPFRRPWKSAIGKGRWTLDMDMVMDVDARGQPLEMPAGNRADEKRMGREN